MSAIERPLTAIRETIDRVLPSAAVLKASGAIMLGSLGIGPGIASAERHHGTDTDGVIAHYGAYGYAQEITAAEEEQVKREHPNIQQLRVFQTRDGEVNPFYGPVKEGPLQEADIYVKAAEAQKQADNTAFDICEPGLNRPNTVDVGYTLYAKAHGYTRTIPASYEPGDKYLHAQMGDVPSTVDPSQDIFGVFNSKVYHLHGEHKFLRNSFDFANLRLKVPAEVGTPPATDYNRIKC